MKKLFALILSLLVMVSMLSACGTANGGNEQAEVETIHVGAINNYDPMGYLDDAGNPTGFEFALFRAIDERLPQYEFVLEPMDWPNLLVALESEKIDIASSMFNKNPEREEKFLFGSEAYMRTSSYLCVLKEDTEIQTIEDLAGMAVNAGTSSSETYLALQAYNEANPDKALVLSTDDSGASGIVYASMQAGLIRASACSIASLKADEEAYGDVFRMLEEPITASEFYQMFRKDSTELQAAVDGVLKEMKEDGSLNELIIEWCGEGAYDVW